MTLPVLSLNLSQSQRSTILDTFCSYFIHKLDEKSIYLFKNQSNFLFFPHRHNRLQLVPKKLKLVCHPFIAVTLPELWIVWSHQLGFCESFLIVTWTAFISFALLFFYFLFCLSLSLFLYLSDRLEKMPSTQCVFVLCLGFVLSSTSSPSCFK